MTNINNGGLLVTIEGATGVGKTYFVDKLYSRLKKENIKLQRMGGFIKKGDDSLPEITKFLRQLMSVNRFIDLPWLCETTLLLAEQAYNLECFVSKAYKDGELILYENYNDALVAYQLMRGENLGISKRKLHKILNTLVEMQYDPFNYPAPDILIYITTPLETIFQLLKKRESRVVSEKDRSLIPKIIDNYEKMYKGRKGVIIIKNDGVSNLETEIEEVTNMILKKRTSLDDKK